MYIFIYLYSSKGPSTNLGPIFKRLYGRCRRPEPTFNECASVGLVLCCVTSRRLVLCCAVLCKCWVELFWCRCFGGGFGHCFWFRVDHLGCFGTKICEPREDFRGLRGRIIKNDAFCKWAPCFRLTQSKTYFLAMCVLPICLLYPLEND